MKIKDVLYSCMANEAFLGLTRKYRFKNNIVVLMYHEVLPDDSGVEAWTVVKESAFIRQMQFLKQNFTLITIDEYMEIMSHNKDTKDNYALVTFDDGYLGNKTVVQPIIDSLEIPISIFVATKAVKKQKLYWYNRVILAVNHNSDRAIDLSDNGLGLYNFDIRKSNQERWLETQKLLTDLKTLDIDYRNELVESLCSWKTQDNHATASLSFLSSTDIKKMAGDKYITFGAHSHCHNILTQLSLESAKDSIFKSKNLLEEWTGQSINHFAYPNGDYNIEIIDILQELGFKSSMSTINGLASRNSPKYEIPRIGIGRYDNIGNFKLRVSGVF